MIWETEKLVIDDLAFGGMTSMLTFIKLTQQTGCSVNWSFRNQTQLQVERHSCGPWPKRLPLWASQWSSWRQPSSEEHREALLQGGALRGGRRPSKAGSGPWPPPIPTRPTLFYHMRFLGGKNVSLLKSTDTHLKTTRKDDHTPVEIIIVNTFWALNYTPDTVLSTLKTVPHLILTLALWGRWLSSLPYEWGNGLSLCQLQTACCLSFDLTHMGTFWRVS